jgi:hypothetical protein
MGMKITKIHRVMEFRQKAFLKPFIYKITSLRAAAKSSFEERLYKLIANSTFGKFIEDVTKYIKVEIATNKETIQKLSRSPHFIKCKRLNDDAAAVFMNTDTACFNKAYSVGFSILELSKLFMYQLYYEIILPYFKKENLHLLFSDTDSFMFAVKTNNLITDYQHLSALFDFSKYPSEHLLYDNSKRNNLFYLKDEFKGAVVCTDFIGLRPKCHVCKIETVDNTKSYSKRVCKGLKRSSINAHLSFDDYFQCLLTNKEARKPLVKIHSSSHQVSTVFQTKKALSNFDSKRYLHSCGIHTSPYGSSLNEKYLNSCYICKN